jgi:hypothetical protein
MAPTRRPDPTSGPASDPGRDGSGQSGSGQSGSGQSGSGQSDPGQSGSGGDDAPGYRSAAYAAALGAFGTPVALGRTGGRALLRPIPGSGRADLAGPYPLFCCADWEALGPALAGPLPGDPVTLTLVADPFCPLPPETLGGLFDICRPLHDHWLIDLALPLAPSRHHRRKLRGAGAARIDAGPADPAFGPDWARLYRGLALRKGITDRRAFDDTSLAAQLAVPGAHLVVARDGGGQVLGADLYYLDGAVAHAHLSAYAPEGYAQSVSYPMIAAAAEYFRPCAAIIDLGGTPAVEAGREGGGVGHFKQGWTRLSRPSHLCGRILDPAAYARLSGAARTAWFPAYRAGEYAGTA